MPILTDFELNRRKKLHGDNPHGILEDPKRWVQWGYNNQWGSYSELNEYARKYKLLHDLKHIENVRPIQLAAWEYLLGVRLMEDIE